MTAVITIGAIIFAFCTNKRTRKRKAANAAGYDGYDEGMITFTAPRIARPAPVHHRGPRPTTPRRAASVTASLPGYETEHETLPNYEPSVELPAYIFVPEEVEENELEQRERIREIIRGTHGQDVQAEDIVQQENYDVL
jgi:hypothetical protein